MPQRRRRRRPRGTRPTWAHKPSPRPPAAPRGGGPAGGAGVGSAGATRAPASEPSRVSGAFAQAPGRTVDHPERLMVALFDTAGRVDLELDSFEKIPAGEHYSLLRVAGRWSLAPGVDAPRPTLVVQRGAQRDRFAVLPGADGDFTGA